MADDITADSEGRLLQTILAHADGDGKRTALTGEDAELSWAELYRRVLALGGAIAASRGAGEGRVAIASTNSTAAVVAYLATIASGGCAVPLPVSANAETIRGMVADCGPDLIFADAMGAGLVGDAGEARLVRLDEPTAVERFADAVPPLPGALCVDGSADFNIIYSSGTTARPKGIVHSHAMRYRQAERRTFGLGAESTMLLATPLYSNTTLMPLLATLFHGGHVVLMGKFDTTRYLDLAEQHGATHTMLVPVQYQRLLANPSFGERDLSRFVLKQCTGAPLAAVLKRDVVARWPGRLLEVFGLTEGGCTCILDVGAAPDKAHTVGRPAPGNDVRVIDEAGRVLPPGEIGEVVGRSPTMMTRYFRNPEATEAFYWYDEAGNRFHRTGDIGRFDKDGYLTLLDRKKDVIISGGFNIYASDLEQRLLEHPDVEDAAVIGVPSEKWGETPLGLVVLRPGASTEPEAVLAWANGRVGKLQRLSAIERRASLPRSPAGKLLKNELKRPYWETQSV